MEKKVPINDIYPLIGKTIKDTYNEIDRLLGDKNPFASIGIGTGFLVWKDARRNWQQMIAASDVEQEAIRATKYELKKELSPILGEENAEKLFTTPDDSYIYYDYDGGILRFLSLVGVMRSLCDIMLSQTSRALKCLTPYLYHSSMMVRY